MNFENLKTKVEELVKGLWRFIAGPKIINPKNSKKATETTTSRLLKSLLYLTAASISIFILVTIVLWGYHKFGLILPTISLIAAYLIITICQRLMFHEIILPVALLLAVIIWGGFWSVFLGDIVLYVLIGATVILVIICNLFNRWEDNSTEILGSLGIGLLAALFFGIIGFFIGGNPMRTGNWNLLDKSTFRCALQWMSWFAIISFILVTLIALYLFCKKEGETQSTEQKKDKSQTPKIKDSRG